ncbi:MAG: acetyl-CoA C-acetyltransferase [Fidelibacterota bacterium]
MTDEIVILPGVRTAFGEFGGSLRDFSATDLGVFAAKGAMEKAGVDPAEIDHVVFGNALQTSGDAIYLSRHIGLRAEIPKEVPALTVNRLCGSGFESIIQAVRLINNQEARFVLAGGTESMSQAPHCIWGARWGFRLGDQKLHDLLWTALTDSYSGFSMAQTAENLAERYGITRREVDEYAYMSQMRTRDAINSGKFDEEIVPVKIKTSKGILEFKQDEHPRPDTTVEGLSKLRPYFKEDGTITAGNASGICDGAASVVITTGRIAEDNKLKPLGKIISWGLSGCDPDIMGIGPAPASKIALNKAGITLSNIDLVEINEAFSPQYLAVEREMKLNREKTNVNGGAIALGHPLAASGTRLTLTLLYELRRRGKRYGLASACIGGGQGAAIVVEAFVD